VVGDVVVKQAEVVAPVATGLLTRHTERVFRALILRSLALLRVEDEVVDVGGREGTFVVVRVV
jgi:hypothetical protein